MGTIKQPGVEILFQLTNLKGDRGLGHMQYFGRLGKTQLASNVVKHI